MAKDPLKYWKADDVDEIAEKLIKEFHPHLAGESILYIFRSEHSESNGKIEFAKAKRVSGLNAYLANRGDLEEMNGAGDTPSEKSEAPPILLIEVAYDVWTQLSAAQRVALIDHELCHFGLDGMRAHDVEEFRAVIDRHGLWRPEIQEFAQTIAQQKLFPTKADVDLKEMTSTSIGEALMKDLKNPKSAAAKQMRKSLKKGESVTISSGRKSVTIRPE